MFRMREPERRSLSVAKALAVVLAVGALAGCGESAESESTDGGGQGDTAAWDFTVVAGPTGGTDTNIGNLLQEFADRVEEETEGQLTITLRAPGELPYELSEQLATVGANRVQLGDIGVFSAGESPAMGTFGLPFLITTLEDFESAFEVMTPYMEEDFEKYGVEPIFHYAWPEQTTWGSGDAPSTLDDLAGRKIRASSPAQAHLLEELGAQTATLDTGEVGPALQQNVVDSVLTSAYNGFPLGWGESVDWGYLTSLGYVPGVIIANQEAMAELPEDVRETVLEIGQQMQEEMLQVIPEAEQTSREAMASENGVELVEGNPDDQERGLEIMAPYWEEWGQDNGLAEAIDSVREELGR